MIQREHDDDSRYNVRLTEMNLVQLSTESELAKLGHGDAPNPKFLILRPLVLREISEQGAMSDHSETVSAYTVRATYG